MSLSYDGYVKITVDRLIDRDTKWLKVLHECVCKIRDGFFDPRYVALFEQDRDIGIYQAYAFAMCHQMLASGKVLVAEVEVGATPLKDIATRENNANLKSLPEPFYAEFEGGPGGGNDGLVGWTKPIMFGQRLPDGGEIRQSCPPWKLEFEVGSTRASRTLFHLLEGGVARWPYDARLVTLLKPVKLPDNAPLSRLRAPLPAPRLPTRESRNPEQGRVRPIQGSLFESMPFMTVTTGGGK